MNQDINEVEIPLWYDRHLHLRRGEMLRQIFPCTLEEQAHGALIMTNLMKMTDKGPVSDPVDSIEKGIAYKKEILRAIPEDSTFEPDLALYLTDHISPDEVVEGFHRGIWRAVKLYMADQNGEGGTTGSAHGVRDLCGRYKVFEAMEKHQIPLLGHWEAVEEDVDEFDREIVSLDRDLQPTLTSFPGMPVVFEHLTDGRAAEFVAEYYHPGGLYATVTAHHMILNRNALFWGGMNPLNYCKPVVKREAHRIKVRKYVTSGDRRFGAGTDSAPHDETAKARLCRCAAGIYTAKGAVSHYITIFDEENALQHFGRFMSENFLHVYGRQVSSRKMKLIREPNILPEKVGNVHVFKGGEEILWKIAA